MQGDTVHLFFSVSVKQCEFEAPTRYGNLRWSPGGSILQMKSQDSGETWGTMEVGLG